MSSHINEDQAVRVSRLGQSALKRLRFAKLISIIALLGGLALALLFLWQSGFFDLLQPTPAMQKVPTEVTSNITGTDAVIHGFDKDGLAFTITSQKAVQDENQNEIVHLTKPTGEFERSEGRKLFLSANSAQYNTKNKALILAGQVVFEQAGRYKAEMELADLDLTTMSLRSRSKVHVNLSSGAVDADHLEITDGGKKTLFTGHVKTRLETDIKSEIIQ